MPCKVLYVFLGRRGAVSRWLLDIAMLTRGQAAIVVSKQNELYDEICATEANVLPIETFRSNLGAVYSLSQIYFVRRRICNFIKENRISRVVILMSHVWTPLLADAIRKCGAEYVVLVHDAAPHPGDRTARLHRWLMRDAYKADRIVVLSHYVADELRTKYPRLERRIARPLFLPDFGAARTRKNCSSKEQRPLRFLFFGRILPYKGLPLFVAACELLRQEGLSFEIGVVGEGSLHSVQGRLEALGATINNRWIDDNQILNTVKGYDAVVLPNTEASQSGVVPVAFAAGCPVIATPVGGIPNQVAHGRNGLLAKEVSAQAIADEMRRLIREPDLYILLSKGTNEAQHHASMRQFLIALDSVLADRPSPQVLIVARCLDIGGTEKHLARIVPELRERGVDISLFVFERGGKLEEEFLKGGVAVTGPRKTRQHWIRAFLAANQLFWYLRKFQPDIVHFFLAEPYLVGSLVSSLLQVQTRIMSRRSLDRYHRRHPFLARLEIWFHRYTQVLLGNSSAVVQDLVQECDDRAKIGLLHNGVNIPMLPDARARADIRMQLGIGHASVVMAIVANLIEYKGHEDLLRALAIAHPHLPERWCLIVAGRDDGIGQLLQLTAKELAIEEHILWLGEVANTDKVYIAADIALIASHEEGFSNSLLEAMSWGLPVVATAIGGNLDAVVPAETGILVPIKAPKAMAAAVLELANDPRRRQEMGSAARARIEARFTFESCARKYKHLYEEVAKRKQASVQSILDEI